MVLDFFQLKIYNFNKPLYNSQKQQIYNFEIINKFDFFSDHKLLSITLLIVSRHNKLNMNEIKERKRINYDSYKIDMERLTIKKLNLQEEHST